MHGGGKMGGLHRRMRGQVDFRETDTRSGILKSSPATRGQLPSNGDCATGVEYAKRN